MTLNELKIIHRNGWIIRQRETGEWIDTYLFDNGTISNTSSIDVEINEIDLEADNWHFNVDCWKGYKVIPNKLCDALECGFAFNNAIFAYEGASIRMLNHESGHIKQKAIYSDYVSRVAIPSFIAFWKSKLKIKPLTHEQYHMQPWEAEADKLGGNMYWENGEWNKPIN